MFQSVDAQLESNPISSPGAFGPGELKKIEQGLFLGACLICSAPTHDNPGLQKYMAETEWKSVGGVPGF